MKEITTLRKEPMQPTAPTLQTWQAAPASPYSVLGCRPLPSSCLQQLWKGSNEEFQQQLPNESFQLVPNGKQYEIYAIEPVEEEDHPLLRASNSVDRKLATLSPIENSSLYRLELAADCKHLFSEDIQIQIDTKTDTPTPPKSSSRFSWLFDFLAALVKSFLSLITRN